jgi:hypothetical protein
MRPISKSWMRRKEKFQRSWDKVLLNAFLHPTTPQQHNAVILSAESALQRKELYENDQACLNSPDPLVRQGWSMKKDLERQFKDVFSGKTRERVAIQVPDPAFSPAGYSLFTNLAESLDFIGVPTKILAWDDRVDALLQGFKPTVLLSSDHATYLGKIDWRAVAEYKLVNPLRVGLTASLEEYGSSPLSGRLNWAVQHGIDFFYSFRDDAYVMNRAEYRPFFEAKYPILYLPFGANVLHYYPVAGFQRDLPFVILATRKSEHATYMKSLARKYHGFIDGPGWRHVKSFSFNRERDRYIYARAQVGLNVHLPEQINWACELNERTYQLAACGVPQLIDHPALLDKVFGSDSLFVAQDPQIYAELFEGMMRDPLERERRAMLSQKLVMSAHTTFHRAADFVNQLNLGSSALF